ncbi:hypothetical protein HPULCUR_011932 [Helicostylum pulchrum]|uniref:F-box domain-containing protein n=1 Tax=Helicostylum pulchrum TaxID=562976 RepID=A0ABP9YHG9_9FUNG
MIPNEVLAIIFGHLDTKQLLQCQLTSRQWSRASLKQLYSKVIIRSDFCYERYIATTSANPDLAPYLKLINFGRYFSNQPTDSSIRNYEILVRFPNMTELSASQPTIEFWTQVCYRADQGQLKYLEFLPVPSVSDFAYYANAALFLSNTLKVLIFEGSTNTRAYQLLIIHLKQFKRLTTICIKRSRNCGLSHYDTLLNHCSNQKYFKACICAVRADYANRRVYTYHADPRNNNVVIQDPPLLIRPLNNAERLVCHWELIGFDNQLNYALKKFPALKFLSVSLYSKEGLGIENLHNRIEYLPSPLPSVTTLINFLQYTFTIKLFDVTLVLSPESISFIWEKLAEIKGVNDDVRLIFDLKQSPHFSSNPATRFKRDQTTVYLNYYIYIKEKLPGKEFLEKAGPYIGSLQVRNEDCLRTCDRLSKTYRNPDYIYQVLDLCPVLRELDFDTIFTIKKIRTVYDAYFPLRSLSVGIDQAKPYVLFLKKLAPTIPELKQLHFTIRYQQHIEHPRRQIKIEMPNIDFDLITWTYTTKPTQLMDQNIRCYLQVKTFSKNEFFMVNSDGLLPISKHVYSSPRSQLRICIVCKELRDFKLKFTIITLQPSIFTSIRYADR